MPRVGHTERGSGASEWKEGDVVGHRSSVIMVVVCCCCVADVLHPSGESESFD
jgi:hypothetical protein